MLWFFLQCLYSTSTEEGNLWTERGIKNSGIKGGWLHNIPKLEPCLYKKLLINVKYILTIILFFNDNNETKIFKDIVASQSLGWTKTLCWKRMVLPMKQKLAFLWVGRVIVISFWINFVQKLSNYRYSIGE